FTPILLYRLFQLLRPHSHHQSSSLSSSLVHREIFLKKENNDKAKNTAYYNTPQRSTRTCLPPPPHPSRKKESQVRLQAHTTRLSDSYRLPHSCKRSMNRHSRRTFNDAVPTHGH